MTSVDFARAVLKLGIYARMQIDMILESEIYARKRRKKDGMALVQRKKRNEMTPVERALFSRKRGIVRMKENIAKIKERADSEIKLVEARIREKQAIVDAIERGSLKP